MAHLNIKWRLEEGYKGCYVVYEGDNKLAQFWTEVEAQTFVRKIGEMIDRANNGLSVLGGVK
jgi:hypothetical protein